LLLSLIFGQNENARKVFVHTQLFDKFVLKTIGVGSKVLATITNEEEYRFLERSIIKCPNNLYKTFLTKNKPILTEIIVWGATDENVDDLVEKLVKE